MSAHTPHIILVVQRIAVQWISSRSRGGKIRILSHLVIRKVVWRHFIYRSNVHLCLLSIIAKDCFRSSWGSILNVCSFETYVKH